MHYCRGHSAARHRPSFRSDNPWSFPSLSLPSPSPQTWSPGQESALLNPALHVRGAPRGPGRACEASCRVTGRAGLGVECASPGDQEGRESWPRPALRGRERRKRESWGREEAGPELRGPRGRQGPGATRRPLGDQTMTTPTPPTPAPEARKPTTAMSPPREGRLCSARLSSC